MPRRTPILAIILAVVALYLVVPLWKQVLMPLYLAVRYSDTVAQWRLDSDHPEIRMSAIKDLGSSRAKDTALIDELTARLRSDESAEVREAAATTLGKLGAHRPLPAAAIDALSAFVLTAEDDATLNAAIGAVGQSAPKNRYAREVIERIANIFAEKRLAWLSPEAARVLGQVGAAQSLPDPVIATMNGLFSEPVRPGERENLANAFTAMAKGRRLAVSTLDMIADAFTQEPNRRIRIAILYALAHSAADYPRSHTVITAAIGDADPDIVRAAESGLRIIEANRIFANKDPLTLAMDTSAPVDERLQGLRVVRSSRIDPAAFEQIGSLARDPETEVAVAALDLFHYLARAPDDDFDRRVLIPELTRAMSNANPVIRKAAYGALSSISIHRPAYLGAGDFPAQLETGAADPDPKIRVIVLVAMLGAASDSGERKAIIERGMDDPDAYVRSNAVSWLASPKTGTREREGLIAQALNDPDPKVRASAQASQQSWETRKRAWPVELWRLWRAGERGKVGMRILIAVTVATPVLIGGVFLLYYMARLLTYLGQRRWRAAAVVPVMVVWVAASYGMFMLYFMAGHTGDVDGRDLVILASVLWGAIAVYAALGWGMHYAVRR